MQKEKLDRSKIRRRYISSFLLISLAIIYLFLFWAPVPFANHCRRCHQQHYSKRVPPAVISAWTEIRADCTRHLSAGCAGDFHGFRNAEELRKNTETPGISLAVIYPSHCRVIPPSQNSLDADPRCTMEARSCSHEFRKHVFYSRSFQQDFSRLKTSAPLLAYTYKHAVIVECVEISTIHIAIGKFSQFLHVMAEKSRATRHQKINGMIILLPHQSRSSLMHLKLPSCSPLKSWPKVIIRTSTVNHR